MKPLDPALEALLSLPPMPPPVPAPQLENRVIAAWRQNRLLEQKRSATYGAALVLACGVFSLTLALSFSLLTSTANPTALLANAALHEVLQP
jgi:hypothetical protein